MRTLPILASLLGALFSTAPLAQSNEPAAWLVDDYLNKAFQVSLDGRTVLREFTTTATTTSTFKVSPSGIAVDPTDDSLWVAQENRGRLINYNRNGVQLGLVDFEGRYGDIEPEGVAIDYADGSLWVVSDPVDVGTQDRVFHLERDGSLIRSFPASDYSGAATSQQAIAADPVDGSLWITDNAADTLFNVTSRGQLLLSVSTRLFNPPAYNVQGVSVDEEDGTLWVSDRGARRIYNLDVRGTNQVETLASFVSTDYDSRFLNPVGVAFDGSVDPGPGPDPEPTPDIDLGAAGGLALVALRDGDLVVTEDASVVGDIAIARKGKGQFKDSLVDGDIEVDPEGDITRFDNMAFSGETVVASQSATDDDGRAAASAFAGLSPTQNFRDITRNETIRGTRGLNVIKAKKIELDGETLTLVGSADTTFVVNVSRKVVLKGRSEIRLDGISPDQVVFNINRDGAEVTNASIARGIFLSVKGALKVTNGSSLYGAALSANKIEVKGGSQVVLD